MIDSKRLATLRWLTAYLAREITPTNGYQFDLSADDRSVVRGVMFRDRTDPLPQVSILEDLDPERYPRRAGVSSAAHGVDKDEWVLLVQGWVEDDKDFPTDAAYLLMADVQKAIAKLSKGMDPVTFAPASPDYRMGGLVADIKVETGVVRPAMENVTDKALFWCRVVLGFVEDKQDPYNLS